MPRFVPAASMRLVVGTATGGLLWAARRKIIWRYYANRAKFLNKRWC